MPSLLRRLFLLGALASLAFSAPAARAGEVIWPLPVPPAGTNPATFPAPRLDWVARVQQMIDQAKGKSFDIIFDGDSITDYWRGRGWTERYAALHPVNFGIAGDRIEHLLWRLQQGQVDGMHPKLVVLLIGSNNLANNTAEQIAEGIKTAANEYLRRCPEAHLLLMGILPRNALATDPFRAKIIAANQIISALDDGKRVTYLNINSLLLQPDGNMSAEIMADFVHPTVKGYQIWADAMQPVIDQYVPAPKAP